MHRVPDPIVRQACDQFAAGPRDTCCWRAEPQLLLWVGGRFVHRASRMRSRLVRCRRNDQRRAAWRANRLGWHLRCS